MSVTSSDSTVVPDPYDKGEQADFATNTSAISSGRHHLDQLLASNNRRRYAEAFKRVEALRGSRYHIDESRSQWRSLEPKGFGRQFVEELVPGLGYARTRETPLAGGFISIEKATVQLEQALYSTELIPRSSRGPVTRLQRMIQRGDDEIWGPDLVAKSFHDWDCVLFNGRLKGYCEFEWKSEDDYDMGHDLGLLKRTKTMGLRWGRVKIQLNADRILLNPTPLSMRDGEAPVTSFRMMFGVLLHEMTHAYLTITTGHGEDDDEEAEGYDGLHGQHFQRCIHAVDKMSRSILGLAACHDISLSDDRPPRKPFDMSRHSVQQPRPSPWTPRVKPPTTGDTKFVKRG